MREAPTPKSNTSFQIILRAKTSAAFSCKTLRFPAGLGWDQTLGRTGRSPRSPGLADSGPSRGVKAGGCQNASALQELSCGHFSEG